MTERMKAWQCIGCGKIEAPQTCVGVCKDVRVEFVYAEDYDEALAGAERARRQAKALEAVVRQLAWTTPREGDWERSYKALQAQARRALAAVAGDAPER